MDSPSGRTIYIGSDHAGFEMKEALRVFLHDHGYEVKDCGNTKFEAEDDYPDFGFAVGRSVSKDSGSLGIVLCGSGVGMCISANKVRGIRAACALGEGHVQSGKRDDDTNVLCVAARSVSLEEEKHVILAWLCTGFEENKRFVRRVRKIDAFERSEAIRTMKSFGSRKIIPAILEKGLDAVYKKLSLVEGLADWVQLDIMDGKFVPEISFALQEFDGKRYPFFYEAHLMVVDPFEYIELCQKAGIDRCIFHWESVRDVEQARSFCETVVGHGMQVGVAINSETDIQKVVGLAPYIESVLLMGVHPGKSGQSMLPGVVDRIGEARKSFPKRVSIGLDGGITQENLKACIMAGAQRIAVGSVVFESNENIDELIERLQLM